MHALLLTGWLVALHSAPTYAERRDLERAVADTVHPSASHDAIAVRPAGRTRTLQLSVGKSAVIEVPSDITDVLIGNPEIADAVVRSRRHVYIVGMGPGETNTLLIGDNNRELLAINIHVTRDLRALDRTLSELLPTSRIRTRSVADSIVLTGQTPTPADAMHAVTLAERFAGKAERVVNLLSVKAKEQVLLTVTVAEVNRSQLRRLGVQWRDLGWSGRKITGQAEIMNTLAVTSGAIAPARVGLDGVLQGAGSGASLLAAIAGGGAQGGLLLEAMERDGHFRILAEPNLTAISGETANFLAGGEFPVPIARNGEETSVEWKSFGVGLAFTPVVLSEGRISLKISTEVSELAVDGGVQSAGLNIPAINVRRVTSSVELPSGGAVVLAGLLSEETRKNADAVPGLNRLPVLGKLFESVDFTRSQTELVVIVAPYIADTSPRLALNPQGSLGGPNGWQTTLLPTGSRGTADAPGRLRPVTMRDAPWGDN
jgi:pilus assembly protein CpaC